METRNKLADPSMAKITSMEDQLSNTLKPVAPRHEFVHSLGQRIQEGNRSTFMHTVVSWHILAMLIAGFASLAVLLAMFSRALVALSKRRRTA